MKKKKIVTVCLVVALMVTAAIGGSLAYFTDTDKADNTFAVGNVKIQLNEQQRNENGDGLEDFVQSKNLYPIVGSAQGEKDDFGMPTADNYVDKMVTVTNTGTEDAYVRAYFAIPSALDDGYDTFNAGLNVLHFNFGSKVEAGTVTTTCGDEWIWKQDNGKWNYFEMTKDGIKYNVYFADYYTTVGAEETTERFVDGVYLDKSFDWNADGNPVAFNKVLKVDDDWNWNNVTCPVFAVAVQAAGFDNAADAVDAAFGAEYNPWGGTVTNWQ